jgi:hypothetical protein
MKSPCQFKIIRLGNKCRLDATVKGVYTLHFWMADKKKGWAHREEVFDPSSNVIKAG